MSAINLSRSVRNPMVVSWLLWIILGSCTLISGCGLMPKPEPPQNLEVWIGSRVGPEEPGVRCLHFDCETLTVTEKLAVRGIRNPTWVAEVDLNQYIVVSETSDVGATREGQIVWLSLDENGAVNQSLFPSGGQGPCHAAYLVRDNAIAVAHYGDGSLAIHGLADLSGNGNSANTGPRILRAEDLASVDIAASPALNPRQARPHAHQAVPTEDGSVLLTDLGRDRVFLIPPDDRPNRKILSLATTAGTGPRHLLLDESLGRLAVVGELSSTVEVFCFQPWSLRQLFENERGALVRHLVGTLPAERDATRNFPSAITGRLSSGYFYVANRGDHSITLFRLDNQGTPVLEATFPCGGQGPWDIKISPCYRFLFVANYHSDQVSVLSIDPKTAHLSAPVTQFSTRRPTCVLPELPPKLRAKP